jgi:hypothetical protein
MKKKITGVCNKQREILVGRQSEGFEIWGGWRGNVIKRYTTGNSLSHRRTVKNSIEKILNI